MTPEPLDDLTVTRLCAAAMGIDALALEQAILPYEPLTEDDQCMALVKKFGLNIEHFYWQGPRVSKIDAHGKLLAEAQYEKDDTLNAAICLCVARMQMAKEEA